MGTSRNDLPLVPYLRVSTAAQAESGIGLDAQRRAIREHARANGLALAGWHEDAGRSGATMTRRPGLKAALAEVDAGRAGGIIVSKIDRLGRSSADVLGLVERAQRQGWRLVALDVGLDSTTPAGELVAAALAMAARFEWRRISERQPRSTTLCAAPGARAAGRPPRRGRIASPGAARRRAVASRLSPRSSSGARCRPSVAALAGSRPPSARPADARPRAGRASLRGSRDFPYRGGDGVADGGMSAALATRSAVVAEGVTVRRRRSSCSRSGRRATRCCTASPSRSIARTGRRP